MIFTYFDAFNNKATIEKNMIFAYNGAPEKVPAFCVKCFSIYNNDFLYHAAVFETLKDAEKDLKSISCGTFKRV